MTRPIATERVRCTAATRRRTENLLKMVERLKLGELRREEMQDLFHFSESGIRKYILDLKAAEVMLVLRVEEKPYRQVRDHSQGIEVYGITKDAAKVAAFIKLLGAGLLPKDKRIEKPAKGDAPNRTFSNRWTPGKVVHDPILEHLFGLVPA